MSRPQRLPSLVLAGWLATSLFTIAPHQRAYADDTCLSGPQGATPAGRHWRYHIEAGTKRHCWYLGDARGKTAQAPAAKQPKVAAAAPSNSRTAAPAATASQTSATSLQPTVANARAEMASPGNTGDGAEASPPPDAQSPNATQNSAPPSGTSTSAVNTRWPDPSISVAQATPTPAPSQAAASKPDSQLSGERAEAGPVIPAVTAAALQAPPYSMPMLLGGLAGALAFAGLLGFGVIKFGSLRRIRRTVPRQESIWDESDEAPMAPWQPRDLDAEPHRPEPQPRGNPVPRSRREIEAASRDIMKLLSKASREAAT